MIPKVIINEIFEAAQIDEVIGDFIELKKRGVNLLGCCPFHDEKTPSFTVSPQKGIYKCFGCGEGGNAVNFVMAHEHFSYPEALRYLAKKYNIEIEEEKLTPEQEALLGEKESLFVVNNFAENYFINQLHNTGEGQSIGLSYFKERGFTTETIEKFKLGYNPEGYDKFAKEAISQGYKTSYLTSAGLIKNKNSKQYDSYRGRVIFPIHSLSGRALGFGGRTLRTDKKIPKYINSPQNEIYDKSNVLYGLFFAKMAISKEDNCYLVEGYTDVISLHQNGVENVVSSSGTSLTHGQIKLIARRTKNITILYDGDVAGIKASFRGIDLILQEGLNVKVVLFPDGEDPDSFAKANSAEELKNFITSNAKDFIVFKTDLLLAESENNPIKKAELIHGIVHSISLIPDSITSSIYIKECSKLLDVPEKALIAEFNKLLRKNSGDKSHSIGLRPIEIPMEPIVAEKQIGTTPTTTNVQEQELIRLMLLYKDKTLMIETEDQDTQAIGIAQYIINDLIADDLLFENKIYLKIFNLFIAAAQEERIPDLKEFTNSQNTDIAKAVIEVISSRYDLSNWANKKIYVKKEENHLDSAIHHALYAYKLQRVNKLWTINQQQLKTITSSEELETLIEEQINLNQAKIELSALQGRVILK